MNGSLSMMEAAHKAREAAAALSGASVDSVASCERRESTWVATVDVLETKARLDNNDLLSTYRIQLDGDGEIAGFSRLRRYYRNEDHAAAEGA